MLFSHLDIGAAFTSKTRIFDIFPSNKNLHRLHLFVPQCALSDRRDLHSSLIIINNHRGTALNGNAFCTELLNFQNFTVEDQ